METCKVKFKNCAKIIFSFFIVFFSSWFSAMSLDWIKDSTYIKLEVFCCIIDNTLPFQVTPIRILSENYQITDKAVICSQRLLHGLGLNIANQSLFSVAGFMFSAVELRHI